MVYYSIWYRVTTFSSSELEIETRNRKLEIEIETRNLKLEIRSSKSKLKIETRNWNSKLKLETWNSKFEGRNRNSKSKFETRNRNSKLEIEIRNSKSKLAPFELVLLSYAYIDKLSTPFHRFPKLWQFFFSSRLRYSLCSQVIYFGRFKWVWSINQKYKIDIVNFIWQDWRSITRARRLDGDFVKFCFCCYIEMSEKNVLGLSCVTELLS